MKENIIFIFLVLILFTLMGVFIYKGVNINRVYDFKIYFFNAGKADCILISYNEKHIMIDTGEAELSDEILTYLRKNNIKKLDYLIITHFDKDHVGSASSIINNIEVENVLQSNLPKESAYYDSYISALAKKGITPKIITGDYKFTLGDLLIVVNGPDKTYENNESNNSSLIVSLNYKETNYLFTGDIQNDRIKDYLSENVGQYDFIKIPYHGDYQKQLDNLLETTKPTYAVITCSNDEPEDIDKTTNLLEQMNIKYYLTRSGSITILSNGKDIEIKQ